MGFFARRRARLIADTTAAVLAAMEERSRSAQPSGIDAIGNFYSNSLKGMGDFLNGAAELALRGAASAMGQRGGRKTQANKRAKEAAQRAGSGARGKCGTPGCRNPLCENPHHRDVTTPMILEYKAHAANSGTQPTSETNGQDPGTNGNGNQ